MHSVIQYIVSVFTDLTKVFGVPPLARKAKPFIDHILTFSILDSKIWFRNFQVGSFEFALIVPRSRIFWYRL